MKRSTRLNSKIIRRAIGLSQRAIWRSSGLDPITGIECDFMKQKIMMTSPQWETARRYWWKKADENGCALDLEKRILSLWASEDTCSL